MEKNTEINSKNATSRLQCLTEFKLDKLELENVMNCFGIYRFKTTVNVRIFMETTGINFISIVQIRKHDIVKKHG